MRKIFVSVLALACAAAITACGGKTTTVTEGNRAQLDSLSYCLGANIGSGIKSQMEDIPFNLDVVGNGIQEGLTGRSKQTQEAAVEILREFFSTTLGERREAIAVQKADPNSTATPIEIFMTAEECDEVSYAFGNDIGNNVRNTKFPLQYHWLLKGFRDAYEGSTEIADSIRQGHIAYVLNTRDPGSQGQASDGAEIRMISTENNVTIFTALDTVRVLLDVLEETTLTISTIDA